MCVIIAQPTKAHLDKDRAARLWTHNSDGGGFSYVNDNDEVVVEKHMEFKPFWSAFEQARSDNKTDFLLHMRIATHGSVNVNNVHPFRVDEFTVMAHNGIIHGVPDSPLDEDLTDSMMFIREVLPGLPDDWLDNQYLVEMVEEWIGWSKLMFITTNPALKNRAYILNQKKGTVADGMWFSNSSGVHKPVPVKKMEYPKTYRQSEAYDGYRGALVPPMGGKWVAPEEADLSDWLEEKTTQRKAHEDIKAITAELTRIRQEEWMPKPIAYADKGWECFGCDETVNEQTGTCECWNKLCLDCSRFAAECVCSGGFSLNLILLSHAGQALIEEANKLGQQDWAAIGRI